MARFSLLILLALGHGAAVFAQSEATKTVTNKLDTAAGAAVIQLLETGDASRFALQMTATTNDLAEQSLTNTVTHAIRPWPFTPESVEAERKKAAASARLFLRLATRLGVDSSQVTFHVKQVQVSDPPADVTPPEEIELLPYKPEMKIILQGESSDARMAGEYTIILKGATKFCSGWRISGGIRWGHVPPGLAGAHVD